MFIDDTVENLDAAAALGFRTLRFPGSFDDVLEGSPSCTPWPDLERQA